MPHLPAEIILVFTPFAPLFSARIWRHAQFVLAYLSSRQGITGFLLSARQHPEVPTIPSLCQKGNLVKCLWMPVDLPIAVGRSLGLSP
jgi:hypothetical protein